METEQHPGPETTQAAARPTPARPSCWIALRRWTLLGGFAYIAWISASRLINTIASWYWLNFAEITPGPMYLAVTGAVWCLVALVALFWILLRRPWFPLTGTSAALFFAITYWIDRLFISADPGGAGNTPFAVLLTLLLLAYTFIILRPLPDLRALARI